MPGKRCHLFCSYISDNFASDFVTFGMLHRNGESMQMGNEIFFSSLLGNAVLNGLTWITQSSQQRFVVSGVVVCQLVCRLAVDILSIIFSHALSIRRLD